MNLNRPQMLSALAIVILSLTIHASAEWKEQVLYSFQVHSVGSSVRLRHRVRAVASTAEGRSLDRDDPVQFSERQRRILSLGQFDVR